VGTKLKAEVQKIENEISLLQSSKIRAWITVISVSVGILVSVFSLYKTLADIDAKNRQLRMESRIRTHQLFLAYVLDGMSGVKKSYKERDENGYLKVVKQELNGPTAQVGSYSVALSLSCEFPNLRFATIKTLEYQVSMVERDIWAKETLEKLKNNECPQDFIK